MRRDYSAATATNSKNLFLHNGFPSIPNPPSNITIGAYYYPWHKAHFQISQEGYLRKSLQPRQEIRLGEYDDTRPEVISQHLKWSQRANINVWVTSWWGPTSREDRTIRDVILPHPDMASQDHKLALLYETTGRIKKNEDYDLHRLVGDMEYVCTTRDYFSHPQYYKIDGRPVMVFYLTRAMERAGKLSEMIQVIRDACPDVYIIGDQVWGEAPDEALDDLDAVTNYDIYGNMGKPTYAGQEKVDEYYQKAAGWKIHANEHNTSFIPSVSPGYNDRGIRIQNDNPPLSRRLTEDSPEGSLFAAQLVQATELLDPTANNFLLVNSFNEWHEDTQIEPVDGKPSTQPQELAQGVEYVGYGTLYLDILRTYTSSAELAEGLDDDDEPTIDFTGIPYASDNTRLAAFYYPWDDQHSFDHGLRANLEPEQQILMPLTSSSQVEEDLILSWQSNVRVWIMPWNSPSHTTDLSAENVFSDTHLVESDQQVALHYNPIERVVDGGAGSWDMANVQMDIHYICYKYLARPNYLKTPGSTSRPVLFLDLTRVLSYTGLLPLVTQAIREIATEVYDIDLYLVGDLAWNHTRTEETGSTPFQVLDAVFDRDVSRNMAGLYAGQQQVDSYYEEQRKWRIAAWKEGCSYLPTVLPGYNDRVSSEETDSLVLPRQLTKLDDEGSFFAASLDKASHLLDDELGNMMLIDSFNNFQQDTQIYPVYGDIASLPNSLTQGLDYEGYGHTYLDILTERFGFHEWTATPSTSPSTVPTNVPSMYPSGNPSLRPSGNPSGHPSLRPSGHPSKAPSSSPSNFPTKAPSIDVDGCDDDPDWLFDGEYSITCVDIHERVNIEGGEVYQECARIGDDGRSAFEACPETCQEECYNSPKISQGDIPLSTVLIIASAALFCMIIITVLVSHFRRRRAKNQAIQVAFFGGVPS